MSPKTVKEAYDKMHAYFARKRANAKEKLDYWFERRRT